jgi:hypothetical protein
MIFLTISLTDVYHLNIFTSTFYKNMNKNILIIFLTGYLIAIIPNVDAQDDVKNAIDYSTILGLALNTDISKALLVLDTSKVTSQKDGMFKQNFENRFKFESDKSDYLIKPDTSLNDLLRIFRDYWRNSMLHKSENNEKDFEKKMLAFFKEKNSQNHFIKKRVTKKNIQEVYRKYIESKGFHTTDIGKTGSLYDLLVWKTEIDTNYNISLIDDTVNVNIHLMDDFISLGWEDYATLGIYYPGGWTTPSSLFCVKKGYDLNSETFLVSYLSHEGQHFSDMQHYPKLSSNDLEYRAKLIELYLSDKYLYEIIDFFIHNANYDKTNAHPFADFCLIRDMSRELFHKGFENDIEKWKSIPKEDIHAAAKKIFLKNSEQLEKAGKDVVENIK